MIGVLLEFEVKPGLEREFIEAWEQTTEFIYRNFGSLGSRLHRAENGCFIAYAQWPNRDVYENEHRWPEAEKAPREAMLATLVGGKPRLLHRLDVVSDRLRGTVA